MADGVPRRRLWLRDVGADRRVERVRLEGGSGPMIGYRFDLACPDCGGALEHVNASRVNAGSECCAIARCDDCSREVSVHVQVRPMPRSSRFAA